MAQPARAAAESRSSGGLTEFGAVEEEKKAGPTGWLRWLWGSNPEEPASPTVVPARTDRPVLLSAFPHRPASPSPVLERPASPQPQSAPAYPVVDEAPPSPLQPRSVRIGSTSTSASVVARNKEYWMPDEACETCYDCGAPFSTFRRKHHCRVCGQIFCWECSDHAVPGDAYGYDKPVRACNYCYKLYLRQPTGARPPARSAAQATPAATAAATGDGGAFMPPASPTPNGSALASARASTSPKGAADVETLISRNYQSIRLASRVRHTRQPSTALGLAEEEEADDEKEPRDGAPSKRPDSPSSPFRHRNTDSSPPPVSTIPSTAPPLNRSASTFSTLLSLGGGAASVATQTQQADAARNHNAPTSALASTSPLPPAASPATPANASSNSNSVATSASNSTNVSPQTGAARRRKPGVSAQALAPTLPPSSIPCSDDESSAARQRLNQYTDAHLTRVLQQQLAEFGLSPQWLPVLLSLARRAVSSVDLRMRNGEDAMDVRDYVKIKRLPGGSTEECAVVNGIVFTKNVAHKQMIRKLHRPRTLLLSCSLEYQRQENRLSSFDSLLQQELKYLEILVSKIASVSPDLVLVERTVSRLALDFLLAENISVVLNIKPGLMPRLSRYTGGEILPSTDKVALSTPNVVGTGIRYFHIETFRLPDLSNPLKSLLFLEAEDASLGATVLLRGADLATLTKVKRVLRTAVYAAHNLRLERSALFDLHLGVSPPPLPPRVLSASPYVSLNLNDATPHFPLLDRPEPVGCPLEAQLGRRVCSSEIFNREELSLDSTTSGGPPVAEAHVGSFEAHQQILYTYSVWSRNSSALCTIHEPVVIEYYSKNDMPLGRFLEMFCFNLDWECGIKECGGGSSDHVRSFFHQRGRLNIAVDDSYRGGLPRQLSVWTRCRVCSLSTPALPVSNDTWNYSFGKFLEQVFYNEAAGCRHNTLSCSHTALRQHEIFFAQGEVVAHLWYEHVEVQHLVVPPLVLYLLPGARSALLESELEQLTAIATRMYTVIMHKLAYLQLGLRDPEHGEELERWIASLSQYHKTETHMFFSLLEEVRQEGGRASVFDVNRLKRKLCANAVTWNASFAELDYKVGHLRGIPTAPGEGQGRDKSPSRMVAAAASAMGGRDKSPSRAPANHGSGPLKLAPTPVPALTQPSPRHSLDDVIPRSGSRSPQPPPVPATSLKEPSAAVDDLPEETPTAHRAQLTSSLPISTQFLAVGSPASASSVATSVASTSSLSTSPGNGPAALSKKNLLGSGGATVSTPPASGGGSQRRLRDVMREKFGALLSDHHTPALAAVAEAAVASAHHDTHNEALLPPAFLQSAQSLLYLPPGCDDQSVSVLEDEPSSVVAFCLLSAAYREQMHRHVDAIAAQRAAGASLSEAVLLWPEKTHIEIRESATNEGKLLASAAQLYKVQIDCTIFYAAQFSALRQYVCGLRTPPRPGATVSAALAELGTDMSFIESLARCKSWDARGGKSGSRFSKTLDERYVIKQISKVELAGFLEFAPLYFGYVCTAYTDVPTAFAKILGVYAITFKSASSSIRHFFVVLENVFYNRNVSQIYDLKGSLRNRFAQADPQEESPVPTVLMDENLLTTIFQQPLCVTERSKSNLAHTIRNDSAFLSSVNVMDYSLLVGVDSNTRELVVGIIDYMRKYTWDKHVESWVKSSGIMGGSGKDPTIISPKQYAARFREAMMQYFVMMPDKFMLYHKPKEESAAEGTNRV